MRDVAASVMHVYILKSVQGEYRYVGMTDDPRRRLQEHNRGGNRSTKSHRPYEMWILATCLTTGEARAMEKSFKTGFGRMKADRMIADGRASLVR